MARNDVVFRNFDGRMKVNVTIASEFVVRLWIAKQLLQLAAWVIGARIEIKDQDRGA